jgi:hypothetical protein
LALREDAHELLVGVRGGIGRVVERHDFPRQASLHIARVNPSLAPVALQRLNLLQRHIGTQHKVVPHQLVGQAHHLAEHLVRRLVDADVVAERLAHLLLAVQPNQQRHQEHHLRLLPVLALQVAPDEVVEALVAAAQFHICLNRHRVIALTEWVEDFVHAQR